MVEFNENNILNGLSKEELLNMVRDTMQEVGIEYTDAPGGIIFHGLRKEDFFTEASIPRELSILRSRIAHREKANTFHYSTVIQIRDFRFSSYPLPPVKRVSIDLDDFFAEEQRFSYERV